MMTIKTCTNCGASTECWNTKSICDVCGEKALSGSVKLVLCISTGMLCDAEQPCDLDCDKHLLIKPRDGQQEINTGEYTT